MLNTEDAHLSVLRYAIGGALETKGRPLSVFAKLPALVERTGNGPEADHRSRPFTRF